MCRSNPTRRPGQRGGHRRADQPAGVHASGAGSPARRAAERATAAGCHDRPGQFVDLPVDRTDAVVAGGGGQRRRTGTDRRHHPQLQRRALRARGRSARSAHSPRHLRRHAGRTARQHHRHHPGAEPVRRHARRTAGRPHPGAEQDTARPGRVDQGAAEAHDSTGEAGHLQRHGDPARQRHPGRPGQKPAEPRADAEGARRRRAGPRHRSGVHPDVPVHPEPDRPRRPRRLREPVRHRRFHERPTQARTLARHATGADRASLVPAPGDPGYDAYYTKFPLGVGTLTTVRADSERRRRRRGNPGGGG